MRPLIFGFLLLAAAACTSPQATSTTAPPPAEVTTPAASYAGEWQVTVKDTPAGTVTGTMILEGDPGSLSGKFVSNGRETQLRSVEETADGLKIEFYSSEYQTDVDFALRGEASAEELTGMALSTYGVVATRKK
ncbi:hypothetical protein [Neolewinella litorea]|uniref:Lipocalin-like domain-containing protein n=1 Tax=Neolewinella litorea TaxID=2562452 RepID=A0A4S4N770_9BACT|nr:hypothetical protein [Neolewinella litorea]THH35006.1 hypothetical protein E4021_16960 [Neolewinella litorea]